MQRQKFGLLAVTILLGACGSGSGSDDAAAPNPAESTAATTATPTTAVAPASSEAPTTVAETSSTAEPASTEPTQQVTPERLRDVRYCEVLLLGKVGDDLIARVWNSMGQSVCPQAEWEELDATAIAAEQGVPLALLNGPRYWTLDSIDATMQFDAPVTSFGSIGMFEAATVNLGPELPSQAPYRERGVVRETVFRFDAGSQIYELTSPEGRVYVMQSYSQQLDPTQTIETLATLGERLSLPEGWTFSTRVLDESLGLLSTDGIATVVQDDFQNTYQRNDAVGG